MHALVIDDSRAMRALLTKFLREMGFEEICEAGNGREALERLNAVSLPDLVLVDWNMPEMNGLEFIRAVRAEGTYRDLCLMMVTIESEMSQMVKALAAGSNEYVMKPFTKDVIQDKLALLGLLPKTP